MNVFIVYASNSGSTYTCAKIIAETLESDHSVTIKKAVDAHPDEFNTYEVILLGTPSWDFTDEAGQRLEGQPHETMRDFLNQASGKTFPNKPFALFGCGDSSYTHFCGAVDHLEDFVKKGQGQQIVDSLRIDSFYFELDKNLEKVQQWAEELKGELNSLTV